MSETEIRRLVRCGACHGSLGHRLNMVCLGRKATWSFPVAGNFLTGESGEACAIICNSCVDAKRDILEAVEFSEAGPVYHPVESLEKAGT